MPRRRYGRRWRAGWVAGCSRRCATSRSLAYTVMASAWEKARAGALLTYIATSPEREDEAREEMLKELDRFAREPVSDAELRQAISYLAGQAEVSRQSGGAMAGEMLEAWIAGPGWRRWPIRPRVPRGHRGRHPAWPRVTSTPPAGWRASCEAVRERAIGASP